MDPVDKICRDIEELKIQGARNVARAAIDAMDVIVSKSRAKTRDEFLSDVIVLSDRLAGLRATEPMLENLLRNFIKHMKTSKDLITAKAKWRSLKREFIKKMNRNIELITSVGSNLVRKNSTILTHCHSSTVERIIENAAAIKKGIKVICTETRPLYQGRITAKNLAKKKIDVTMIVDNAIGTVMRDVDIILVGADLITVRGQLVNKVGTSNIAMIANSYRVPFYSAAELWKYDPMTKLGMREEIEQRNPDELIADLKGKKDEKSLEIMRLKKQKKIKLINPAFDVTNARYITAFITEEGIIPPTNVPTIAGRALR